MEKEGLTMARIVTSPMVREGSKGKSQDARDKVDASLERKVE